MAFKSLPLILALAVALSTTTACSNRGGGGGGGTTATTQSQKQHEEASRTGSGATKTGQVKSNVSSNLTGSAHDWADISSRASWVQANIAAGDWERSLDDVQYIQKKMGDIEKDKDVHASVKSKVNALKPKVDQLAVKVQKHDKTALKDSRNLVVAFSDTTDQLASMGFMAHPKGGGAGMGNPPKKGAAKVGPKKVGPKKVGPAHKGPAKVEHKK